MRIGLVSKFGSADGLCVRAEAVLNGLIARGHDVHVFTQVKHLDGVPDERVHQIRAKAINPHFWLDSPGALRTISEKSKEYNLEVLHVQMNSSSTELLIPYFKYALPPVISTFHFKKV